MTVKLDIEEFVADYCGGAKDRDLLEKHHLSAKELIATVKKLIGQGAISKEQYFARNRLVEETEIHEEKQFLKSLYHCPVCSHMDPRPFERCPACGTEITESQTTRADQGKRSQAPAVNTERQVQESFVSDAAGIRSESKEPGAPAVVDGEPTPDSLLVEPAGDYPAAATEGAAAGSGERVGRLGQISGHECDGTLAASRNPRRPRRKRLQTYRDYRKQPARGSRIRPNQRPATVPYL